MAKPTTSHEANVGGNLTAENVLGQPFSASPTEIEGKPQAFPPDSSKESNDHLHGGEEKGAGQGQAANTSESHKEAAKRQQKEEAKGKQHDQQETRQLDPKARPFEPGVSANPPGRDVPTHPHQAHFESDHGSNTTGENDGRDTTDSSKESDDTTEDSEGNETPDTIKLSPEKLREMAKEREREEEKQKQERKKAKELEKELARALGQQHLPSPLSAGSGSGWSSSDDGPPGPDTSFQAGDWSPGPDRAIRRDPTELEEVRTEANTAVALEDIPDVFFAGDELFQWETYAMERVLFAQYRMDAADPAGAAHTLGLLLTGGIYSHRCSSDAHIVLTMLGQMALTRSCAQHEAAATVLVHAQDKVQRQADSPPDRVLAAHLNNYVEQHAIVERAGDDPAEALSVAREYIKTLVSRVAVRQLTGRGDPLWDLLGTLVHLVRARAFWVWCTRRRQILNTTRLRDQWQLGRSACGPKMAGLDRLRADALDAATQLVNNVRARLMRLGEADKAYMLVRHGLSPAAAYLGAFVPGLPMRTDWVSAWAGSSYTARRHRLKAAPDDTVDAETVWGDANDLRLGRGTGTASGGEGEGEGDASDTDSMRPSTPTVDQEWAVGFPNARCPADDRVARVPFDPRLFAHPANANLQPVGERYAVPAYTPLPPALPELARLPNNKEVVRVWFKYERPSPRSRDYLGYMAVNYPGFDAHPLYAGPCNDMKINRVRPLRENMPYLTEPIPTFTPDEFQKMAARRLSVCIIDERVPEGNMLYHVSKTSYIYHLIEYVRSALMRPANAARYAIVLRANAARFSEKFQGDSIENEPGATKLESVLPRPACWGPAALTLV